MDLWGNRMLSHIPLLSLLIWTPIVGGLLVLLTGGDHAPHRTRFIALFTSLISIALCVLLYMHFDTNTFAFQFREHFAWISDYKINYDLGVDGISMPLVILTVYTTLLVILASWKMVNTKISQYLATFLVMQGMVIGVFSALDSILFYVFWEGMLVPMYLSIGIWGGDNRSYAAIKFFLFTFFGSALMLIALLYLGIQAGSFSIPAFYALKIALPVQMLIFVAFFLAFAVKVPMWPVHTWLPDAHTEAPVGGSVILAALMLKMGAYGFLRFSLPITPDASDALKWVMIGLSLVAVIYIGIVALAQTDMKRLIAYSSVSHMGFVTLGCFMVYVIVHKTGNAHDAYMSMEGAMVQMISHAFGSGAMFLAFGMLYERMHTRLIDDFGGIAKVMPVLAVFFMVFAMSNVGLPGTSGFVGEFMVILSAFKANMWVTVLAAMTLIVGASYTLWMYKRVFFGEIASDTVAALKDVDALEISIFVLLAVAIFFIGLYPEPLLKTFHASVGHLLDLSLRTKV